MAGIFLAFLILIICMCVSRYMKNENSPIISTKAQLIDRKCYTDMHTDANGIVSSSKTLYLMFELDTGSQMKFVVNAGIYRNVPKNEWGTLTFQGTRFLKFATDSVVVER
jgi:hypothetical protein